MKRRFSLKKSTIQLAIGVILVGHASYLIYSGHEVRSNPDVYNNTQKIETIVNNFAGIGGGVVGCGLILAGYIRRRIERDNAVVEVTPPNKPRLTLVPKSIQKSEA